MNQSEQTLDVLLESKPVSFELLSQSEGIAHGIFEVESEHALGPSRFALRIECTMRRVRVREANPGEQLPEFCPERHIESDSNLCLGLRAGQDIATPQECATWWSYLYQFLVLQISASRTRTWPPKYALAHGEGGGAQLRATRTARRLGLADDYADYLLGAGNFIAELVRDYEQRQAEALDNGRPIAHLDDTLLDRATTMAMQRGSSKLTDRKRARLVRALAKFELERAKKEQEYWDAYREHRMTCCGTMRGCLLQDTMS